MTTLASAPATHTAQQAPYTHHSITAATRPAAELLRGAKFAYTTRFVADHVDAALMADAGSVRLLAGDQIVPRPGDVVLAEVVEIGQHTRLESPHGRRQTMYVGDRIVVAYGHRYAPDQFEAVVPLDLGETNLVAAGGVAGEVISQHASIDPATVIRPLGLIQDERGRWTLSRFAPHTATTARPSVSPSVSMDTAGPTVVLSIGSTMNSGKTTTAACLIRGLTAAGLHVTAGKATGTGAGRDPMLFTDSGAVRVVDFTDFGHSTTSRLNADEVLELATAMITELSAATASNGRPDVVVVEIADGVLQSETSAVLQHPELRRRVDGVVFASGESLGAIQGHDLLHRWGFPVAAVSGVVTSSPLAAREAAAQLPVPVVDTFELSLPQEALAVCQRLGRQLDPARDRDHSAATEPVESTLTVARDGAETTHGAGA